MYLLNLIYTVLYFYIIRKMKINFNFFTFLPILFIWILIIGFQYDVGTDYFSYLDIFNGSNRLELFFIKKEFLFYYLVKLNNFMGMSGQGGFIIVSIIQGVLFYKILKELEFRLDLFLFIFLVIGTTFYNQLNTIRSHLVIYLMTLYTLKENKYRYFYLVILSVITHRVALTILPIILLIQNLTKLTKKKLAMILFISIIISLFSVIDLVKAIIIFIKPYRHYLNSDYLSALKFSNKILKYLMVPLYFYSLKFMPVLKKEKRLYTIGFLSFCIRIVLLISSVTNRIGEMFSILSLIPLYYLFENKKNFLIKRIIILLFLTIFILKVTILSRNEYIYKSYLIYILDLNKK